MSPGLENTSHQQRCCSRCTQPLEEIGRLNGTALRLYAIMEAAGSAVITRSVYDLSVCCDNIWNLIFLLRLIHDKVLRYIVRTCLILKLEQRNVITYLITHRCPASMPSDARFRSFRSFCYISLSRFSDTSNLKPIEGK